MLRFQRNGAIVFDYGNNIRAQAQHGGVDGRVRYPRLRARIHPAALLRGQGPVPLGGALGRSGRHRRDRRARARAVRGRHALCRWIRLARERVAFQGLPARIFWLGYGERARFGLAINDLVRRGVREGADRHRPRSPRRRVRRLAQPRNRSHARRQRRDCGLADAERAAQHVVRCHVGFRSSWRRRRDRLLSPRRDGCRGRRDARG